MFFTMRQKRLNVSKGPNQSTSAELSDGRIEHGIPSRGLETTRPQERAIEELSKIFYIDVYHALRSDDKIFRLAANAKRCLEQEEG